jgi:hypothetical protein
MEGELMGQEQLRMILEAVSGMGAEGIGAFKFYLFVTLIKATFGPLATISVFGIIGTVVYKLVYRFQTQTHEVAKAYEERVR